MAMIAIYSPKGGVGKTSLSVNLAWAASQSGRRVVLWDLDAQGAASFILAPKRKTKGQARDVLERGMSPLDAIVATDVPRLDLLPADESLRTLDVLFDELGAKKRLLRIGELLAKDYDHVIIDSPPGLGITAEQVIRGAALIVLPQIPSTLSRRTAEELEAHLGGKRKGAPPILPVYNLVDRRRLAHRQALEAEPGRPAVPMASLVEQMADRHAPLGAYAPGSPAAKAIRELWTTVERRLAKG